MSCKKVVGIAVLSLALFTGVWQVSEYIKNKDLASYHVAISGFNNIIFDYPGSYLTDEKGKLITYYGGHLGGIGALGFGSQSSGSGQQPLPAGMHIRFFDPIANQFWQGQFTLPQEKLRELFTHCNYVEILRPNRPTICPFWQLIINATPSGQVFVYAGRNPTRFIGSYQAQKTDMKWEPFYFGLGYPDKFVDSREVYVANMRNDFNKDELMALWRNELKETPSPYEPAYWQHYFNKYEWKLTTAIPFTLVEYNANYVNGEMFNTFENEANQFRKTAVPYDIFFVLTGTDGSRTQLRMEFNQKYMMKKFEEAANAGKPIEFHADFDEKAKILDTYLTEKDGRERIELEAESVENKSVYFK